MSLVRKRKETPRFWERTWSFVHFGGKEEEEDDPSNHEEEGEGVQHETQEDKRLRRRAVALKCPQSGSLSSLRPNRVPKATGRQWKP